MQVYVVKNEKTCDICGEPFDVKYVTAFGEQIYSSCFCRLRTVQNMDLHYLCPECADKVADFIKELKDGVDYTYLKEKCGSCKYSEPTTFGKSKVWVRCTNEEHLKQYCKGPLSDKRQRTQRACKSYKSKEEVV